MISSQIIPVRWEHGDRYTAGSRVFIYYTDSYDKLSEYPWIKNLDHLMRVNKYRKRVGQSYIRFNDDDMAELVMLR